jgi:alkaline phosphatase D
MDNFNALPANQKVIATELVAPGIASNSLFSFFLAAATLTGNTGLLGLILANATTHGGSPVTENFNLLLTGGVAAAGQYAASGGDPTKLALAVPTNPHIKYVDTNTQGYGYIKVGEKQVDATIVTINRPIVTPATAAGPGVKRTASFTIPVDKPEEMTGPTYTGTKPFPADHA